jgi:putative Mg2+ transporter-C (MgtC) family protein
MLLAEPTGQGWEQIAELAIALVLSALIGLEREYRQKSAGLRTHTLIGFSSALIVLVSKYGFTDVLGDHVVLDPSRVAAQIVSGIGFIGGGLIFVKRDLVRGLTTAAAVWLTTAVGMAAGSGLPVLAAVTTAGYFLVAYGFTPLAVYINRSKPRDHFIQVVYQDGRGLLRQIVNACTVRGWVIARLTTRQYSRPDVSVLITLRGSDSYEELAASLTEIDGVLSVAATRPEDTDEEPE